MNSSSNSSGSDTDNSLSNVSGGSSPGRRRTTNRMISNSARRSRTNTTSSILGDSLPELNRQLSKENGDQVAAINITKKLRQELLKNPEKLTAEQIFNQQLEALYIVGICGKQNMQDKFTTKNIGKTVVKNVAKFSLGQVPVIGPVLSEGFNLVWDNLVEMQDGKQKEKFQGNLGYLDINHFSLLVNILSKTIFHTFDEEKFNPLCINKKKLYTFSGILANAFYKFARSKDNNINTVFVKCNQELNHISANPDSTNHKKIIYAVAFIKHLNENNQELFSYKGKRNKRGKRKQQHSELKKILGTDFDINKIDNNFYKELSDLKTTEEEVKALKNEIKQLNNEVKRKESTDKRQYELINNQDEQISALQAQVTNQEEQLTHLAGQVEELKKETEERNTHLNSKLDKILTELTEVTAHQNTVAPKVAAVG